MSRLVLASVLSCTFEKVKSKQTQFNVADAQRKTPR